MGAERTIDMAEDKNIFFDSYELEQSDLADLADLFKVFGDATRISIMFALLKQELSVGDIAERLEMNASAISHQLRAVGVHPFCDIVPNI